MSTDYVYDLSQLLAPCVTGAIGAMDSTIRPQEFCYRVGSEIVYDADAFQDMCCKGLAYISLGDIVPSSASFPEADIVRQANSACAPASWAVQFRVGIIRCAPVGGPSGSMPTCEDWTGAFLKQLADAQALRRIACCFRSAVMNSDTFLGMSVVIGRQTGTNPFGGCIERYVPLDVQMPNCDCFPQP